MCECVCVWGGGGGGSLGLTDPLIATVGLLKCFSDVLESSACSTLMGEWPHGY